MLSLTPRLGLIKPVLALLLQIFNLEAFFTKFLIQVFLAVLRTLKAMFFNINFFVHPSDHLADPLDLGRMKVFQLFASGPIGVPLFLDFGQSLFNPHQRSD